MLERHLLIKPTPPQPPPPPLQQHPPRSEVTTAHAPMDGHLLTIGCLRPSQPILSTSRGRSTATSRILLRERLRTGRHRLLHWPITFPTGQRKVRDLQVLSACENGRKSQLPRSKPTRRIAPVSMICDTDDRPRLLAIASASSVATRLKLGARKTSVALKSRSVRMTPAMLMIITILQKLPIIRRLTRLPLKFTPARKHPRPLLQIKAMGPQRLRRSVRPLLSSQHHHGRHHHPMLNLSGQPGRWTWMRITTTVVKTIRRPPPLPTDRLLELPRLMLRRPHQPVPELMATHLPQL